MMKAIIYDENKVPNFATLSCGPLWFLDKGGHMIRLNFFTLIKTFMSWVEQWDAVVFVIHYISKILIRSMTIGYG